MGGSSTCLGFLSDRKGNVFGRYLWKISVLAPSAVFLGGERFSSVQGPQSELRLRQKESSKKLVLWSSCPDGSTFLPAQLLSVPPFFRVVLGELSRSPLPPLTEGVKETGP